MVAAFSQSWKRSNELTKVQQQNNYPLHKLKGDVSTRWGSTAVMVRRILEQNEAIRVVLSSNFLTSEDSYYFVLHLCFICFVSSIFPSVGDSKSVLRCSKSGLTTDIVTCDSPDNVSVRSSRGQKNESIDVSKSISCQVMAK